MLVNVNEFMDRKPVQKKLKRTKVPKMESVGGGGIVYESSVRGNRLLHYMGHKYIKNNVHGANIYWKCTKWHNGCKARAITNSSVSDSCSIKNVHNHGELSAELCWWDHDSFSLLNVWHKHTHIHRSSGWNPFQLRASQSKLTI